MNTNRTAKIAPVLLATAIALGIAVPAAAESTAELLEKGIYTEQTVGDLKAAIEIYTRVVENAEANRPHLAQAQFRLGICYVKSGSDAEARQAFEKLIRDFPEQEQFVAQAREQLAAAQPALALGPVPWEHGETLKYQMSLPTGKVIGSIFLMAESTVVDGTEAWQLELRRFVFTNADNYGVSRILVEHDTQRPIRSTVRHGLLGNADASYGVDGVEITGAGTDTHVDCEQQIYDNDQSMHLMRMLPFEPGYEVQINLLPIWTGQILKVGLEVTGREMCQVPAGEFECYVVDLDIGQTYWFSTGPERYPLKLKAGGVVVELAEIGRTEPEAPVAFGVEDFGFSGTLPAGWLFHEHRSPGRANKVTMRLLDPEAEAISTIEVDRCPDGKCPALKQTAERELAGCRERFENYELREESWTERTIDGRPAISFVGDYMLDEKPWVQYRIYTITDHLRLELIFRTPVDRFEGLRAAFDSVAENLKAE
jgi:hypothetical protein